jgi:hypothetical protein
VDLLREVPDGHVIPVRKLRFTTEEDEDLERPTQEQEEWRTTTNASSSIEASRTRRPRFKRSSGNQQQIRSTVQHDHRSGSDQFLQQVPSNQQVYNDKMWLLFIRSHSTSARTSARSDRRAEPAGQIRAPVLEPMRVERSTSNASPPQKEYIHAQSAGHG